MILGRIEHFGSTAVPGLTAVMPRSQGQASVVRAAITQLYLTQKKLLGRREKLIKVGAKVVRHSKYVLFQLAEVAVPRQLFARILGRIARLCSACASG